MRHAAFIARNAEERFDVLLRALGVVPPSSLETLVQERREVEEWSGHPSPGLTLRGYLRRRLAKRFLGR